MTELNKAGDAGSLGDLNIPQGEFRQQMDVIADEMRQLAGNADIPEDPLNAPYILYVNPYTGSDVFVGGQFNSPAKLERRISNQRLECGYTEARPFKTVNRAALEAAIITSRGYLDASAKTKALVTIVLSSGEHIVENAEGIPFSAGAFPAIADGTELTVEELATFNDSRKGAVILPRGCSLISLDLRKTVIRPGTVTGPEDEFSDYSNRRSILKVTGGGYYYGITFRDNLTANATHHLLHCFEFTSQSELDALYQKVLSSFASADISPENTVAQETEYEITGPKPDVPSEPTDTVASASPYIYNCSIRSIYGLCGIFANGDESDGFRSMVVAQFTGVSLQRDMRCWEKYEAGSWRAIGNTANDPDDYEEYIALDPNNVRMAIGKRSCHVRAVNDSIIQEVSVFAIGQGVHHWAESGGELTVTNSNSNFGGVAALADGFRREAQQFDSNFQVREVRSAVDPFTLGSQVTEITLGFIDTTNNANTRITLLQDLVPGRSDENQPEILDSKGYSLKGGDYIWIDNPNGPDYRAILSNNPYDGINTITVTSGFETDNGNQPDSNSSETDFSLFPGLPGLRVYVRRFLDIRTVDQRRYSLRVFGRQIGNRLPVRDYILQPVNGTSWEQRISSIRGSEPIDQPGSGAQDVRIELIYTKIPERESQFDSSKLYRKGDTVRKDDKHFVARVDTKGDNTDFERDFAENFVHMQEGYAPEGNFRNAQPILIFDKDTQSSPVSSDNFTLGNSANDPDVLAQVQSAVDYIATFQQLQNFGADPDTLLALKEEENRDTDVERSDYRFELRRPTNIRLFGQAWEWAGFLNYTKALPDYQQTLNPENKFTYYFTNEAGGKVFCNGFNEEGLQVSPRGLEDVTTGEILSADNLSSPDREINTLTELNDVKISNLEVVSYKPDTKKASKADYGIARLYNKDAPDRISADTDVLTFKEADETFTKAQARDLPFQILHVIPGTPLEGVASIPYGFPDDSALQYAIGDPSFGSLTEAFKEAAKIFVPSGSSILISVHGSRSTNSKIEDGPLQLANSFAEVIVAGARGSGTGFENEPPTIFVDRTVTKNALGRTPQYTKEYAFSAGVLFADIILDCECKERRVLATVNGGFGVGGFNTKVVYRNSRDVATCATTYGKQARFQFYNEDPQDPLTGQNTVRVFSQVLVNPFNTGDGTSLDFFGAAGGSGLVSQGCDLILDFITPGTGNLSDTSNPRCVFKWDIISSEPDSKLVVQFFDAGGRGGAKSGGRSVPTVDLDFSGKSNIDATKFIGNNFALNQNFCGRFFRIRSLEGTNPNSQYNMSSDTVNQLKAFGGPDSSDGLLLKNGCCIDITSEELCRAGPFGFYLELEKFFKSDDLSLDPNYKLLRHETASNSYIYNSEGRDISTVPAP